MRTIIIFITLLTTLRAADWPQFLGPQRNGVSQETKWNKDWDNKPPKVLWKAKVGQGCASAAIADGRVYTTGHEGKKDTIYCFEAETGKVIWKESYNQRLGAKYYDGGTSATPLVDGDRLYTVGKDGDLFCRETETGKTIWQKSFPDDFGGKRTDWGWAATPYVEGDVLITDPGGKGASIVALNKLTGATIWKAGDEETGYTAPVRFNNEMGDGVLIFNAFGLIGYDWNTGKELFKFRWKTRYDINASMPILSGTNQVFISSGYDKGSGLLTIKDGNVEAVWQNENLALQFQNAIKIGDQLYAINGQTKRKASFRCLDLRNGELHWNEALVGDIGTVILAGDHLIGLTDRGQLLLVKPNPKKYEQIGETQILGKTVWAAPALANGLLYTRNNDGDFVCVDLR